MTPEAVAIVEVGLRDGLQNEKQSVSPEMRADWFNALSHAGLRRIEVQLCELMAQVIGGETALGCFLLLLVDEIIHGALFN